MLRGKKIVVTGAASGIGAESARLMNEAGAEIVGVDRRPVDVNVDQFIEADLSDPASISAAVDRIGPGVDALCNIAGLPPTSPAAQVLAVNALGLKCMTEQMIGNLNDGAAIVNVSSLAGSGWMNAVDAVRDFIANATFDNVHDMVAKHDAEGARSYFFSKEIVNVWTMQNRWTWRDRGIRMNSICPGPVDTPILKDFIATLGERAAEDMKVMDRPGRPTDIAPVVAFLCADASAWIRGANLPVDGGLAAHVMDHVHGLT